MGWKVEMPTILRGELKLAKTYINDRKWHQVQALEAIHSVALESPAEQIPVISPNDEINS